MERRRDEVLALIRGLSPVFRTSPCVVQRT